MIDSGEQYYAPGVMDYLNGYPAFRTNGGTIIILFIVHVLRLWPILVTRIMVTVLPELLTV